MRNVWAIACKDIKACFVTPVAYVVMTGYLLLSGFFFFTFLQDFNPYAQQMAMINQMFTPNLNQMVIEPFYMTMQVVLIFLVPLLTMRSIAEEKHNGTFEMLATSPITVGEIVLGKAIGLGFISFVMLALSFVFPAMLMYMAAPEHGPIFIGFLGMLLFTWSFSAIGLAISSFTKNQTIAGVVSLVSLLVLYAIDAPSNQLGPKVGGILKYLAPTGHLESLIRGVLVSSDVLYFCSVILAGLFVANRVLDAQRWR